MLFIFAAIFLEARAVLLHTVHQSAAPNLAYRYSPVHGTNILQQLHVSHHVQCTVAHSSTSAHKEVDSSYSSDDP